MMNILKENKVAILFLLVFVALYVSMNTIYGLFIEYYSPQADPVTLNISKQVAWFLSWFDNTVNYTEVEGSRNILLSTNNRLVIRVFEGCNGINVMIVFVSFIIAFRGTLYQTIWFTLMGLVVIHVMNLGRVSLLYAVELYFPQYLYYIHKYLFTGFIYAVVFFIWYQWIKIVKRAVA